MRCLRVVGREAIHEPMASDRRRHAGHGTLSDRLQKTIAILDLDR
jgi:hypothetical protein